MQEEYKQAANFRDDLETLSFITRQNTAHSIEHSTLVCRVDFSVKLADRPAAGDVHERYCGDISVWSRPAAMAQRQRRRNQRRSAIAQRRELEGFAHYDFLNHGLRKVVRWKSQRVEK